MQKFSLFNEDGSLVLSDMYQKEIRDYCIRTRSRTIANMIIAPADSDKPLGDTAISLPVWFRYQVWADAVDKHTRTTVDAAGNTWRTSKVAINPNTGEKVIW